MPDEGVDVTLRIVRKGPLVERRQDGVWMIDGKRADAQRSAALDSALGCAAEVLDERREEER